MTVFNMDAKEVFVDDLDFSTCNYDREVYYKRDEKGIIVVAHVVDDFTILASSPELKRWIISEISKFCPDITIQHELKTVLGIDVNRDRTKMTITLKQEGSIQNDLNAHYPDWKTTPLGELPQCVLSPMPPRMSKTDILLNDRALSERDKTLYEKKIGELVWITHTVPEFMFAYKLKAEKSSNPKELDMKHVDNIIRYLAKLQRAGDIGLVLGGDQGIKMIGTVDISYAPDGEDYNYIIAATLHMASNSIVVCYLCVVAILFVPIHP